MWCRRQWVLIWVSFLQYFVPHVISFQFFLVTIVSDFLIMDLNLNPDFCQAALSTVKKGIWQIKYNSELYSFTRKKLWDIEDKPQSSSWSFCFKSCLVWAQNITVMHDPACAFRTQCRCGRCVQYIYLELAYTKSLLISPAQVLVSFCRL